MSKETALIILAAILGVCAAVLAAAAVKMKREIKSLNERVKQSEATADQALLRFLNLQTKPHFLANCLSIIYSLALDQEYETLLNMVSYLTRHMQFRYLEQGNFVTVNDELERAKNYLEIMKIRYPNAFAVQYSVSEKTLNCSIAPFSIQPFVDNCIRHGKNGGSQLQIKLTFDFETVKSVRYLRIAVDDNGKGAPPELIARLNEPEVSADSVSFAHVGIINVRLRFDLLYGKGRTKLVFSSPEGGGFRAVFLVPSDPESKGVIFDE